MKRLADEFPSNRVEISAGFSRSSQPVFRSTGEKFLRRRNVRGDPLPRPPPPPPRAYESYPESSRDSAFVRSSRLIRDILAKTRLASPLASRVPSPSASRRLTVPKLSSRGRIIRKLVRPKILEGVARRYLGEGKFSLVVFESKG